MEGDSPARDLVVYDSKTEVDPKARVAFRDRVAKSFLLAERDSYCILDVQADTASPLSEYDDQSLFQDDSTRIRVLQMAERYFTFRFSLFAFHQRKDRPLSDLAPWRRPFTHADLEDEDIEQRFPDDMRIRAAMRALDLAIESNQWRHVAIKRLYQLWVSVPVLGFALFWFFFGLVLCAGLIEGISPDLAAPLVVGMTWSFGLVFGLVIVRWPIQKLFVRLLKNTTDLFKFANETSCSRLASAMTTFNGKIRERFARLLSSIKDTSENLELVKSPTWADNAQDVFKIAMWEAKRIECAEKFWQSQLERLRVFELMSDKLGNASSVTLAAALSLLAAVIALVGSGIAGEDPLSAMPRAAIALIPAFIVVWQFGRISRRPRFSFGMADIVDEFRQKWVPFASLKYHETLSKQFKWGMDAKRTNTLQRQ